MAGTPYLAIDVRGAETIYLEGDRPLAVSVRFNGGAWVSPIASLPSPEDAGARRFFYEPGASFSTLDIKVTGAMQAGSFAALVEAWNIARTDTIGDPVGPTPRQQTRLAQVGGSAPTQASIRLYDATPAPLGFDVMVYTSSNTDWSPPLRKWRVDGDAEFGGPEYVSGAYNVLTEESVYQIPASALGSGTFALMARLWSVTDVTLTWSVRIVGADGADVVGSSRVLTGTTPITDTDSAYRVVTLASIPLPFVEVEGDQMVELTLSCDGVVALDEAWLFDLTHGALTWVSTTDLLHWIDVRSPELGADRPHVFGGVGAFGTNPACIDWMCESFGAHRFDPGPIQVWTMTSSSIASQSEIEHYERSHTHVEGDDAA